MGQAEPSLRPAHPLTAGPATASATTWSARLARPAVVLTVVPAMVLAVGLAIGLIGWQQNVAAARNMAKARLEDDWRGIERELLTRFGCSDALLGQVEAAARRLGGDQDPMAWYNALAPLFAGRSELYYASFSTADGRFFGVFADAGGLEVNFNDQERGGHRRRWKVSGGVATSLLDDVFPYDPRQRPFWRKALASGDPVWTSPYRFVGPVMESGITRTHALYDADHQLLGVATVDWTTSSLSRTVTGAGVGIADRLIVTAAGGEVLVESGSPLPPARPLDAPVEQVKDLNDPVATAMFDAPVLASDGFTDLTDPGDGQSYLAIRRPLDAALGWSLALAARREPLLAPARPQLAATALVIILILPFSLLMAWSYARHVVRVNRAAQHARDAANAAQAEAQRLRIEQERQELEQLSTLGLLAGGIAHDVRNSLTCVLSVADLLRSRQSDPERLREYADLLARSGEQANTLCRDLLLFARKGTDSPEDYDAHAAVRTAASVFSTTGRSVTLEMSQLVAQRHWAHGNRNQLQTAILNLCLNARDAMRGQGVIHLSSSVHEVTADEIAAEAQSTLAPGPHLLLTVADAGEGMDEGTLRQCLDPLFTTKGERGTGLGLVTVQRMVKQHRGSLRIVSSPGKGTCVTLVLPLADQVP